MWEELKQKIESDLEYYEDGRMCSMMEQANGMSNCRMMLNEIEEIEKKYSKQKQSLRGGRYVY